MTLERVREVGLLIQAADRTDSETIIQAALHETPDDADLLAYYAMFLHPLGRTEDIERVFSGATPHVRYAARLSLSRALLARDEIDAADATFRKVLAQGIPSDPEVLIDAGEYAAQLGHKGIAEELFSKALQHALSGPLLQRMIDVARFFDPPRQAAKICAHIANQYPDQAIFHILLGEFTVRLGDRAQGYEHFAAALEVVKPGDVGLRLIFKHIMEGVLRGRIEAGEAELIQQAMRRAGNVFHPQTPALIQRMAEKAALYNSATAGIDPGPIGVEESLALARRRLPELKETITGLMRTAPESRDVATQTAVEAIRTLGRNARTDLDVWCTCLEFAKTQSGSLVLAGGAPPPEAFLLAGIILSLQSRDREALACLLQGLEEKPRHWLALWRAAFCASRLGFADVSLSLARAVTAECPEFTFADNIWKHPLGYYAQDEQDIFLDAFFELYPAEHRTFVEVGAFDPRMFSNSRRLLDKGWRGIMIEPSPDAILRLRAEPHPGATVVEMAAGNVEGSFTLFEPQWPGLEGGGGTSMIGKGGGGGPRAASFSTGQQNPSATIALGRTKQNEVPCRRLDDILAAHWPHNMGIDLLCVDVETAEPLVFEGFNLEQHLPRLLIVETATIAMERRFFAAGYRIIMTGPGDTYYARV